MHISSYGSIYAVGHKAVLDIFSTPVVVQEKIDGSQFSFRRNYDGSLSVRSKGTDIHVESPPKMFEKAIQTCLDLLPRLQSGTVYRGEYLEKPKHNVCAYDRVPARHVMLFDADIGHQEYLGPEMLEMEAARLGLEVVPTLHTGMVTDFDTFKAFLTRTSVLGGALIEGIVVKNYQMFGPDKKILMAKYVSEAFKETRREQWSTRGGPGIIDKIVTGLGTEARWLKAIQHLKERDALVGGPQDIGPLLREIGIDTHRECADDIKDALFKDAWPEISRGMIRGFPQWYKERLAQQAFPAAPVAELTDRSEPDSLGG